MDPIAPYIESPSEPGCSIPFGYWIKGYHASVYAFRLGVLSRYGKIIDIDKIHIGYYRVINNRVYFYKVKSRGTGTCTWTEF